MEICKHCMTPIKRHAPIRSEEGRVLVSFPYTHYGTRKRICVGINPIELATPMTEVDEVTRILEKYEEVVQVLR